VAQGLSTPAPVGHSARVQIQAHGSSDVGRVRQLNEDHFLIDHDLSLYLVCDGMGGHAAGDVASKTAAETVRSYLSQRRDVLTGVIRGDSPPDEAAALLRHGIQSASAKIHELGQKDTKQRGMGTTCTALLVLGGKGVMGHVGDSRLYLARGGRVYQLSEDHTFINEALRRGMMTPEQAAQSVHQNVVTRAVGPSPSVLVDTLVFDILPGDTLLLCSDGLHGYFKDATELAVAMRPERLEEIGMSLIGKANERGGSDNITTLMVRAVTTSAPEAQAQSERAKRITSALDALGHIVLFSELDMKELVKVGNAFRPVEYENDQVVVHEGDVSETLFVIVSGSAKVTRNGADIAMLRAGDHFGEMALLSRRPRSATVRTMKKSRLLALEKDRFYELMQGDPVIAAKFLWRLAQTLSLRLDDVYLLQDRHPPDEPSNKRVTKTYGLFPSPFDGR
jgi:PPM family protein phosphatase